MMQMLGSGWICDAVRRETSSQRLLLFHCWADDCAGYGATSRTVTPLLLILCPLVVLHCITSFHETDASQRRRSLRLSLTDPLADGSNSQHKERIEASGGHPPPEPGDVFHRKKKPNQCDVRILDDPSLSSALDFYFRSGEVHCASVCLERMHRSSVFQRRFSRNQGFQYSKTVSESFAIFCSRLTFVGQAPYFLAIISVSVWSVLSVSSKRICGRLLRTDSNVPG